MAKLVDAPGLGPDARNGVGVRVPLLAPVQSHYAIGNSFSAMRRNSVFSTLP